MAKTEVEIERGRKRDANQSVEDWLLKEIAIFGRKYKARVEAIKSGGKDPNEPDHDYRPVEVSENLFWFVTFGWGAILLALIFLARNLTVGGFPVWPILLLPLVLYTAFSVRQVPVDKIAAAEFFGRPVMTFTNGPKFVWWLILDFVMEPASVIPAEFPGDQDKIFRGDEKAELPKGMVRPIRVLFAEDKEGELPTDKQMAADVSGFTIGRLVPERFWEFRKRIHPIDTEGREQVLASMRINAQASPRTLELMRTVLDIFAKVTREIAGQMSYNQAHKNMGLVNELLLIRLQYAVIGLGFNLTTAGITQINGGHTFNEEIQQRGIAKAERDRRVTLAEAERMEITKRGEGEADALKRLLDAQTKGLVNQANKLGVDGASVLNAQVAQKLAESGSTVVLGPTGLDNLVGLAVAKTKKDT